jgi:hypothetical protein
MASCQLRERCSSLPLDGGAQSAYSPARSYFACSGPTIRFSTILHGAETRFGPFEDVPICQFERPWVTGPSTTTLCRSAHLSVAWASFKTISANCSRVLISLVISALVVDRSTSSFHQAAAVAKPRSEMATPYRFAQSTSRSRRTAGASGFFILSHWSVRPARYGVPSRLLTMPSHPSAQACW